YAYLFNYYKELIKLRKNHPAFRMTSAQDIAKNIKFDNVSEPNLISYSILNNANGDEWKEIKVILNGSEESRMVKLPKGDWTIIASDGNINAAGLGSSKGGKTEIAPTSAYIVVRK
ncbi:MAG: DUF3372 domain-containing protein, partial [Muribaculaceae bacterium]|nr:DUF3372 domain-containing protein [Muribaculaceae bacterium]